MEGYHGSVLLKEVLESLNIRDTWYLDATLGDGGHSIEIIKRGGRVVGIDQDPLALERVKNRFEKEHIEQSKYILVRGNFRDIDNLFEQMDIENLRFAGAVLDLGVSSLQLETPDRGFSFGKSGPLDMRMDPSLQVRALDLINGLNKGELYELFDKLGEEKFAKAISDAVVYARQVKRIETTNELASLVAGVYRRRKIKEKIHPATRVFQALRIVVNDELNVLKEGLPRILGKIEKNGHILVISFHSLEDRIVKTTFREWADHGLGEIVTDKPIVPSEVEVESNPRSRSAKLRVFKVK
ncbi:MAG: 16S rRNA (cytosine(1402)-N(4))-methyltransferase RsmH [Candidatus Daviesbacteria bacterium]|nr:16S rRNA (cytosine(1402)-N(4))-methyltransferase RsmH [Candidatus Daviesbacteria bacterium]